MDFTDSKIVKANKDHKCEFCTETITKGTKCEFNSGKFDGNMFSYYMCDRCVNFINTHKEVREDISQWGFEYGDYESWLDWYGIKNNEEKLMTNEELKKSFKESVKQMKEMIDGEEPKNNIFDLLEKMRNKTKGGK
jgi:hypothetical protein